MWKAANGRNSMFVVAALIAATGGSAFAAPCSAPASEQEKAAAWKKYRARYPYLMQGVATAGTTSAPACALLVVAEPPPHVRLKELIAVADALETTSEAFIGENPSGRDGWTKDIVLTIDGSSREELAERVARVHQYLFKTSYRARTVDLDAPAPSRQPSDLNVGVTTGDLNGWLVEGRLKFVPLLGGKAIDGGTLGARSTRPGVYTSSAPLVAWVIPIGDSVEAHLVSARQFTMESDLIVGGLVTQGNLVIIGRRRTSSYDELPPLRLETIMLLAKIEDSFGQSYERNSPLAGLRNGDKDPEAWAPIFLSEQLKDTEYGHLLNITDQILKSWSNAGQTRYGGFAYPDPKTWPFGTQPAPEYLKASSLVYNWNTRNLVSATPRGSMAVIGFAQTGALPLTYIPGDSETIASKKASNVGKNYFAESGDAYLARVVQYVALFELFRFGEKMKDLTQRSYAFGTLPPWDPSLVFPPARSPTQLHVEATTKLMLRSYAAASEQQARDAASKTFDMFHRHNGGDKAQLEKEWTELQVGIQQQFKKLKVKQLDALAKTWLNPSATPTKEESDILLLLSLAKSQMHALIDIEKARKQYSDLEAKQNSRWSHTPTWVASVNDFDAEGGHNIDFGFTETKFAKPAKLEAALGIPTTMATPSAAGWAGAAKPDTSILATYRGSSRVRAVRVERMTDSYNITFDDRSNAFTVWTMADVTDVIATVASTQADVTWPLRLHLETFSADEARNIAKSTERLIANRGSEQKVEALVFEAKPSMVKQLNERRSLKDFELETPVVSGDTIEVGVSTGTGKLKKLWFTIKLRFRSLVSGPLVARAQQLVEVATRAAMKVLGRSATFPDAAGALHRELERALKAEGIDATPEIIHEALDLNVVERSSTSDGARHV